VIIVLKLDDVIVHNHSVLKFGAVAIGRNEGERLKRCIASLSMAAVVVYVDSGSTDGSAEWARSRVAEVVNLDMGLPFTAACARNVGFKRLCAIAPDISNVQFIDGDCELIPSWPQHALAILEQHSKIAAICGRRREKYPKQSIYNWLCDREWEGPVGEVRAFGGDVMMRVSALQSVGGYRDDLIAGEEPELCVRLRSAGWRIWRIDAKMTLHDAAMTRFGQWWRRARRGGYAFAQGAYLHGSPPERHFAWEARRAWLWGICLPLLCITLGLAFGTWGWAVSFVYPLQILRQTVRNHGSLSQRALLALFQVLARFPEGFGQINFLWDRLSGRRTPIIEYK
jgi:GT2 family glycosyltransferase